MRKLAGPIIPTLQFIKELLGIFVVAANPLDRRTAFCKTALKTMPGGQFRLLDVFGRAVEVTTGEQHVGAKDVNPIAPFLRCEPGAPGRVSRRPGF